LSYALFCIKYDFVDIPVRGNFFREIFQIMYFPIPKG
jgi:hypothetical protein